MIFSTSTIDEEKEKEKIAREILQALPDWFGIEAATEEYVKTSKNLPFFAVYHDDQAVGFIVLKLHNPYTAEIYVMGILKKYHRRGLGKVLVGEAEKYCLVNKMEYLSVKTLDASRENEAYDKTRRFYESVGFKPLEVFPTLWDESNPCLFMAKYLDRDSGKLKKSIS